MNIGWLSKDRRLSSWVFQYLCGHSVRLSVIYAMTERVVLLWFSNRESQKGDMPGFRLENP